MTRRSPLATKPLVVLAAWTIFVWVNRVRNIVKDQGWVAHWRMGAAGLFVVAAVALLVLVALVRQVGERRVEWLGLGLAVVGGVWWLVRDASILLGDHSSGFKVVHTVLATVTIGLSVWVVLSTPKPVTSSGYG